METAVLIAFPELSPVVDDSRERACDEKPSIGVPPHVTLLYPFVPTETVEGALDGLRELFAATPAFDVTFRELRRFYVSRHLPVDAHVAEAVVLEELEPDVRWDVRARFALAAARP